ncbi:hypothetical protein ACXWQL_09400, partial [Streptococcus pyogenes]
MNNMDREPQLTSWVDTSDDDEKDLLIKGPLMRSSYYWLALSIADPWQHRGVVIEFINGDGDRQYLP